MTARRKILATLFAMACVADFLPAFAQSKGRIQLSQLEVMFANMRANTKWNIDGPLLWGYFFFDPSEDKLTQAGVELENAGYHLVGVGPVQGKPLFRLHVEKVEVHTPSSLNQRNIEFYEFAEKHSIASYDGMDVGPAPVTAK
jgi:hypothetical protein